MAALARASRRPAMRTPSRQPNAMPVATSVISEIHDIVDIEIVTPSSPSFRPVLSCPSLPKILYGFLGKLYGIGNVVQWHPDLRAAASIGRLPNRRRAVPRNSPFSRVLPESLQHAAQLSGARLPLRTLIWLLGVRSGYSSDDDILVAGLVEGGSPPRGSRPPAMSNRRAVPSSSPMPDRWTTRGHLSARAPARSCNDRRGASSTGRRDSARRRALRHRPCR